MQPRLLRCQQVIGAIEIVTVCHACAAHMHQHPAPRHLHSKQPTARLSTRRPYHPAPPSGQERINSVKTWLTHA
jgi:hypothetical protein